MYPCSAGPMVPLTLRCQPTRHRLDGGRGMGRGAELLGLGSQAAWR